MSFILLAYVVFLMVVLFMRYRSMYTAGAMIIILAGMTTACLVLGLIHYQSAEVIVILNSELPRREFLHLMAGWYVLDAFCILKIIRNYRDYRSVNTPRT